MNSDLFDLDRSVVPIPACLRTTRYNAARYPGAAGVVGVEGGANCQQYAYTLLRHHGFELPGFRSSELWDDKVHTAVVEQMAPFDLVLVHRLPQSWGAHVGICVGDGLVLHLSKRIGVPAVETLDQLQAHAEHRHLIGFKRVLRRQGA